MPGKSGSHESFLIPSSENRVTLLFHRRSSSPRQAKLDRKEWVNAVKMENDKNHINIVKTGILVVSETIPRPKPRG